MKKLLRIAKEPDTATRMVFVNKKTQFNQGNIPININPTDKWSALVHALELKEEIGIVSVTAVHLVPEDNEQIIGKATAIGAATTCISGVAEMHCRPHLEHVEQTCLAISPNLCIAAGISGAIQHLAGFSASKTIVAINTNSEASFFKAANYSVVGDAMEVIPRIYKALKNYKAR